MIDHTFPRGLAAGILCVSLLAAILLPGHRPGLATVLVAAAVAGLLLTQKRPRPGHDALTGLLALALISLCVIRDATWVLIPALTLGLGLASLAASGGTSWTHVGAGLSKLSLYLPAGVVNVWRPLAPSIPRQGGRLALRGAMMGAGLLALFGFLFASADAAFAHLAADVLTPALSADLLTARLYAFGFVLASAGSLAFIALDRRADPAEVPPPPSRGFHPWEWSVALALLNALFALFVVLQIAVLFGGRPHVVQTAGLTYAQYARQGFFQLVAVAALVLMVVAAANRWAIVGSARKRRYLKGLLGLLCVLTLVILASALKRLDLYEDTFGLTRLRISVHATILWLGAILLAVLISGLIGGRWLPRTVVYVSAAVVLGLGLINPDARIAEQNVDRYNRTGKIDTTYLSSLSTDAVAELTHLPGPERTCVLSQIEERTPDRESWLSFNTSRSSSRPILKSSEAGKSASSCAPKR